MPLFPPMPGVVVVALALGAGCVAAPAGGAQVPDRGTRRAALRTASTFATVLSHRAEVDALAGYPVVILDPDAYESGDLAALRSQGVLSLGYVNIGEAEGYRTFTDRVEEGWVLGENPHWPGHRFVDAREAGWRSLVVDVVAARVAAREFDGFFLDMADVAAPGVFPETRDGVVALIRELRAAYPTHAIVMNRGLFLVEEVGEASDGLLVEGVWARCHPASETSDRTAPADRESLVRSLTDFRDRFGGAAFALDYADRPALEAYARGEARDAGLPVFVSTVDLGRAALTSPPHADS